MSKEGTPASDILSVPAPFAADLDDVFDSPREKMTTSEGDAAADAAGKDAAEATFDLSFNEFRPFDKTIEATRFGNGLLAGTFSMQLLGLSLGKLEISGPMFSMSRLSPLHAAKPSPRFWRLSNARFERGVKCRPSSRGG